VQNAGSALEAATSEAETGDALREGQKAAEDATLEQSLYGSINDANAFARANFAGRFVTEDQLANLERALQDAYAQRGMTFQGIDFGTDNTRFVPVEGEDGQVVGGRIELEAESDAVRWIDIVDETSHALDELNPQVMRRIDQMRSAAEAELAAGADVDAVIGRVREEVHAQLFNRAAGRIQRGDAVMSTITNAEDAALLRRYAREYTR
jgi:hypothetical protein